MLDVGAPGRLRFKLLGQPLLAAGGDPGSIRISAQKGLALLAYLAMQCEVLRSIGRSWRTCSGATGSRPRRGKPSPVHPRPCGGTSAPASSPPVDRRSIPVARDRGDRRRCAAIRRRRRTPTRRQGTLPGIPGGLRSWMASRSVRSLSTNGRRRAPSPGGDRHPGLLRPCQAIRRGRRRRAGHPGDGAPGRIDPTEEERLRRLLILDARYRGPDAALARAKELVARLKREVDAEPEPATRASIDDIKRRLAVSAGAQLSRHDAIRPDLVADPAGCDWQRRFREGATASALAGTRGALGRARGWPVRCCIVLIGARLALDGERRPARQALARSASHRGVGSRSVAVAALAFGSGGRQRRPEQRKGIIPIVVLPFTTYEDAGSVSMIADMMTDDLTNALSRIG